MQLLCVGPPKIYLLWCRLWFYDCLRSSEIEALPTFFSGTNGNTIFSWNLWLFRVVRSSLCYISEISSVFCRFIFRIYTFSCRTVSLPSEISSSCRSDELYLNCFCYRNHILYGTSTIHSADTGFPYAFLSCHFCKQYKAQRFNPLKLMVNSMKTSFAQQSIVTTPSANHTK